MSSKYSWFIPSLEHAHVNRELLGRNSVVARWEKPICGWFKCNVDVGFHKGARLVRAYTSQCRAKIPTTEGDLFSQGRHVSVYSLSISNNISLCLYI
jgi:hypothetical protein